MEPVCEIWRSDDVEASTGCVTRWRCVAWRPRCWAPGAAACEGLPSWSELRLMVQERDLVYARWILSAAGVDCWPEPRDERKKVMADVLA